MTIILRKKTLGRNVTLTFITAPQQSESDSETIIGEILPIQKDNEFERLAGLVKKFLQKPNMDLPIMSTTKICSMVLQIPEEQFEKSFTGFPETIKIWFSEKQNGGIYFSEKPNLLGRASTECPS